MQEIICQLWIVSTACFIFWWSLISFKEDIKGGSFHSICKGGKMTMGLNGVVAFTETVSTLAFLLLTVNLFSLR